MSTSAGGGKLVVVGQGYVGLPLAVRAAECGRRVVGVDSDRVRVWNLQDGQSYVDDVDSARLKAVLESGNLIPTDDYDDAAEFDTAVITVPTPLRDSAPDLTHVHAAVAELGARLRPGALVVLESTTYPGTTAELVAPVLEQHSGLRAGADFHVGYSPERIDPGNRRWNLVNTPKVISALHPESRSVVREFYAGLVDEVVEVSSPREAELAKLLENTFRHVNIALVNEMAVFAHRLGIDIWEAIDAASSKPFGFMRFSPGPGVGGHCLPVDPGYLSWAVRRGLGQEFRFVELADDVNARMPEHVLHRLAEGLRERGKPLRSAKVMVLGIAYKPNTADVRESPALRLLHLLGDAGAAPVVVDARAEPHRCPPETKFVGLSRESARDVDAAVLITDHDDVDYDLVLEEVPWLLDTRNRLRGANVQTL
ncbi:nucleotide sugar dehydrogenase [Saccharopolyspora sp. HNM0983]|uniref:Nucleotide sugar dehydrogenase n=1 Tax=Saccharopolyspora montiporae TaxID=2781240 RepID=A0A929BEC2_9PSEU|nr:nucleotide sugar dehydrogenase [Saccharopolyspora sp. HNM0983]MBE9376496.1 nucleotide sugar dehydrogenase [Saccharopolyspora sp. HNM0983]